MSQNGQGQAKGTTATSQDLLLELTGWCAKLTDARAACPGRRRPGPAEPGRPAEFPGAASNEHPVGQRCVRREGRTS